MASPPDTIRLQVVVDLEPALDAMSRVRIKLAPHRQKLIATGWTDRTAEQFIGEVAQIIFAEMVAGLQVKLADAAT